jgi:hypothetical protein
MNIENQYPVAIFRFESGENVYYKMGLSNKDKDGNYFSGYIPVQFRKGVELENKTKIYLKKAWLTFYLKKENIDGVDKNITVPYIFVSEFEKVEEVIAGSKEKDIVKEEAAEDPFKDLGNELVFTDDDLPF